MLKFHDWAHRWGIPPQAMAELVGALWYVPEGTPKPGSEAFVQSRVRIEAAGKGVRLYRNNVGAGQLANGSFVRWGLANDSKALNDVLKSGDLIGWRRVLITPDHVGKILAQFVSRECKRSDFRPDNSTEFEAQKRWAALINNDGGDAAIVHSEGSL
jgi:hypothetical protein